ncbi:hypothetical protein GT348_01885 [Aristophania vespae]|uniref:Polysaccharide export protein N-terminal domain-containing protein n=1 Tax=Aristophania vespae TaxID=2697033 RepID=A0A6P1NF57_9PROT|nr:polysaccharide biosynthesis/export family protein [Aristophania vespae]QHI95200.1 hypothetical protein GT348_01885 [Aristophania vespae]UMM64427.1 hypothetical protein DM15PD_14410 [Aristophania vespae]
MRSYMIWGTLFIVSLTGCSLPTSGPTRQAVIEAFKQKIINIDENVANQMNMTEHQERLTRERESLARLRSSFRLSSTTIQKGDNILVKIASFTPENVSAPGVDRLLEGFRIKNIGSYIVAEDGKVDLPYIGRLHLAGQSNDRARQTIQNAYMRSALFVRPYVSIEVEGNGSNGIAVTGDVSKPKILAWQPGGIDIARALTLTDTGNKESNHSRDETHAIVEVVRRSEVYKIAYDVALRESIPLSPGDKIIVMRKPSVRTTIAGGGILHNGTYKFQQRPSLMEVIARAGGLNANNADITNIFIFRRNNNNLNVMRVNFRKGTGITTASILPIKDDDVIYAPEARIVPWLRVLNIAFQLALPAAVMK